MKFFLKFLVVAIFCALMFGGCGENNPATSAPATGNPNPPVDPTPPGGGNRSFDFGVEGSLVSSGTLRIVNDPTPYSFGVPTGEELAVATVSNFSDGDVLVCWNIQIGGVPGDPQTAEDWCAIDAGVLVACNPIQLGVTGGQSYVLDESFLVRFDVTGDGRGANFCAEVKASGEVFTVDGSPGTPVNPPPAGTSVTFRYENTGGGTNDPELYLFNFDADADGELVPGGGQITGFAQQGSGTTMVNTSGSTWEASFTVSQLDTSGCPLLLVQMNLSPPGNSWLVDGQMTIRNGTFWVDFTDGSSAEVTDAYVVPNNNSGANIEVRVCDTGIQFP